MEDIIVFNPLTAEDLAEIVDIQLRVFNARLGTFTLSLSPEVRAFLAEKGYQPAFGARPLKRAMRKWLEDPLATYILKHGRPEDVTLEAVLSGEELVFHQKENQGHDE